MKIQRLKVNGFGSLQGEFIFSSDRCNLVLEPNESGKSTLAAAILAALYGFPRQRASRENPIKIKEQYRPWRGGAFAVEMEMECRERRYIVKRDFENEVVTVYDGRTGKEITGEFSSGKDRVDLGEALTGLSREDFIKCCFVGQREIESLRDAGSLTHALQKIASSQQGDVAAGEALAALQIAVDRNYEGMKLGRGKVETEIKRLDAEIDEVRREIDAIVSRRRESEEKIRRLEEAILMEGRAEADLARVDFLCLLSARDEAGAALEQCTREEEELSAHRAEAEQLAPWARFPAERLGRFRELKGRLDSLLERRQSCERRLHEEVEVRLAGAKASLAPLVGLQALDDRDASLVADRLAVVNELWRTRREKRQALRREERRLREAGVDPGRVTQLATTFAPLSEQARSFLSSYREKFLEVKAALSEAERLGDRLTQAEGGESPALVSLAAARIWETAALVTSIVSVALAGVLLLALENKIPFLAAVALAGAGFIAWLRLHEKRAVPGAEQFGSGLQRAQTDVWSREKELASLQERLGIVSSELKFSKPDRLLEEFRELDELQQKAAPLATLAASLAEVKGRFATASGEILDLMQRVGRAPASRMVTPRLARRFKDDLEIFREARAGMTALEGDLASGRKDLAAMDEEIGSLRREMADLFPEEPGHPPAGHDPEGTLARFEEAAAKRERHDRLVGEIIPAAQRRTAEPGGQRVSRLRKDLDVLSRQIEKYLGQSPEFEGLKADKSSREYIEERRRLQEEVRSTQRERLALAEELGDVLKEYRKDYPGRQTLLSALEAARVRAVAFRDAVAIASEVLAAISREAYAEWAEILNERTTEILRRINPNYNDVRFDTDLSFTLRDARTGQRRDRAVVDTQFSSGARDQIYLAVRLAVSEYLSATGVRLPFILDDPFASFDDERFERSMEFLLDTLARRHQILILSCHEERHRRWQERSSGTASDMIRVLDLTPLST